MPSPYSAAEPTSPNGQHSRSVQSPKTSSHHRGVQDFSRPLPVPPGPSVDNYAIPSLRKKPAGDQPSPTSHTRSFSHPFSLLSSKRHEKTLPTRQDTAPTDGEESVQASGSLKSSVPQANNPRALRADRQPVVTGRCMTCDSTVRWPQGLKVFRCTTCLTINDLEPFVEPRLDPTSTGPRSSQAASRKPVPISLDRTRSIIDHCLTKYLEQQLNQVPPVTPNPANDGRETPEDRYSTCYHDDDSPPPSPRPILKMRSTSDPALTPMRSRRRDMEVSTSNDSVGPLPPDDTTGSIFHEAGHEATEPMPSSRPDHHIFSHLENYIAGSFTGCAALNASFFTVKPLPDTRSTPEDMSQRRQASEPTITPTYEPDGFISELDAKTLLLGDFAENGSWWLGGRSVSASAAKDQSRPRERSQNAGRALSLYAQQESTGLNSETGTESSSMLENSGE